MNSEIQWPYPASEESRLRELESFKLVNTPAEGPYDGLAELAAALFQAPIALVTLMDAEYQWFKARVGTDWRGTCRDHAFCNYTICGTETRIYPDLQADPRFANHPLVVDSPAVRFYAGAPLVTSARECIGTICVLDVKPRHDIQVAQLRLLERLAQQAVTLMEHDRLIAEMRCPLQQAA